MATTSTKSSRRLRVSYLVTNDCCFPSSWARSACLRPRSLRHATKASARRMWGKAARTGDMVRADLRRAKAKWITEITGRKARRDRRDADFLSERDAANRVMDFHAAGRHTYITRLGRAGVPMKVMQGLARHSTIALTARYTHMGLSDHTAALDSLPALDLVPEPDQGSQAAQATGTDGKPGEAPDSRNARSACAAPLAANADTTGQRPSVAGRIGGDQRSAEKPIQGFWHGRAHRVVCRRQHGQ